MNAYHYLAGALPQVRAGFRRWNTLLHIITARHLLYNRNSHFLCGGVPAAPIIGPSVFFKTSRNILPSALLWSKLLHGVGTSRTLIFLSIP